MGVITGIGAGLQRGSSDGLIVTVQHGSRPDLIRDLLELFSWRAALVQLVKRELKVRYRRSVLGQLWSMLNPLLTMAVTAIVFSQMFRFDIPNFPIYILSAQLVWTFFSAACINGTTSVLSSAGLARRLYLPPALFPLAAVGSAAVNWLLALVPLFVIVLFTSHQFTWALLFLPIAFGLAFLFTFGFVLILATASVFFHDTVHTVQVVLAAWMYLTPIFYPASLVPTEWAPLIQLNPVYHLVELFRSPIYAGELPDPVHIAAASAYALGAVVIGWWYIERSRGAFPAYL
jgi:ABC-type polysaccharide/polyol phosphate export permease